MYNGVCALSRPARAPTGYRSTPLRTTREIAREKNRLLLSTKTSDGVGTTAVRCKILAACHGYSIKNIYSCTENVLFSFQIPNVHSTALLPYIHNISEILLNNSFHDKTGYESSRKFQIWSHFSVGFWRLDVPGIIISRTKLFEKRIKVWTTISLIITQSLIAGWLTDSPVAVRCAQATCKTSSVNAIPRIVNGSHTESVPSRFLRKSQRRKSWCDATGPSLDWLRRGWCLSLWPSWCTSSSRRTANVQEPNGRCLRACREIFSYPGNYNTASIEWIMLNASPVIDVQTMNSYNYPMYIINMSLSIEKGRFSSCLCSHRTVCF